MDSTVASKATVGRGVLSGIGDSMRGPPLLKLLQNGIALNIQVGLSAREPSGVPLVVGGQLEVAVTFPQQAQRRAEVDTIAPQVDSHAEGFVGEPRHRERGGA